MQSQGIKLVGALLAGIGAAGIPLRQSATVSSAAELPDVCDELPE